MKIVIPMAGRGSRLRPHTLTVPKPLVKVAGKPIVQRIVEDLSSSFKGEVEEVAFIIGDFGEAVEQELVAIAERIGARGTIYHQEVPLGPGHAVACAADSLTGNVIVAFADTLFRADFNFDKGQDGFIWTKQVENPASYGVVQLNEEGIITNFVEKPTEFVSDLAIVGIYYFNDGARLRDKLHHIIDNDIREKGEYQLTTALELLKQDGVQFRPGIIEEWLDCGNKEVFVYAHQRTLDFHAHTDMVAASATITDSVIHQPCFIGENVVIENAIIGPHVSIGDGSTVKNAILKNTVVQEDSHIQDAMIHNSMVGSKATFKGRFSDYSIGDYTEIEL